MGYTFTPHARMELTRQIVAAVATMMIVGSLFVVLHDTPRASVSSSAATQLFNDLGNEYVEGYSCYGLTQNVPCSPIGGECEGFISQSCACKSEYSGYPCDWGPKVTDPITSYSNSPPMNKTEELQRIARAYGFANAIYKEQDQMTAACPGFADDDSQAVGTSQIHLISNDASTHAGASLILPGSRSPSGRGEAIFGFRGTEFGNAIKEITGCVRNDDGIESVECSYNALKTVLTDMNIQRKDLNWTSPDGTVVNLGYMHKGIYDALAPVLPDARIYLTTFGSPRVGSAQWAKLLATPTNTHILRVVAGDDVVSLVPTSVGVMDSVIHAGPQLTVGWDTVSSDCTSLVDITNMYDLILDNSAKDPYSQCAISSVSQFHLNYTYSLQPYLESQGYSGYQWCRASDVSF